MNRERRLRFEPRADVLAQYRSGTAPSLQHCTSQLCTASQIFEEPYAYWCRSFRSPVRFQRKQWEFVYILECARQAGKLASGMRAAGFGCGREPLPIVLAKHGMTVLASDLPAGEAARKGWVQGLQHADGLETLHAVRPRILDRETFFDRVTYRTVDMNAIPGDLGKFDFVWSACALEHLGSLRHGIDFILNTAKLLTHGGVAVHTTEFNLSSNDDTVEDPNTSVYRRRDIEELGRELEAMGCELMPVNYHCGDAAVDEYVDMPPYRSSPNLKIALSSYAVSSIGLFIRKP